MGFCHRTESDRDLFLFLFIIKIIIYKFSLLFSFAKDRESNTKKDGMVNPVQSDFNVVFPCTNESLFLFEVFFSKFYTLNTNRSAMGCSKLKAQKIRDFEKKSRNKKNINYASPKQNLCVICCFFFEFLSFFFGIHSE